MTAVRLVAIGDLSFEGPNADRPCARVLAPIAPLLKGATVAVANLECALVRDGRPVAGKCTLHGAPGWASVMKGAGIHVVTLANNHVMDYGGAGLTSTLDALSREGIHTVGAGPTKEAACAPLFLGVNGVRIAFLARTSVMVSSPSSATPTRAGVAWLDRAETERAIRDCRGQADLVVLLIHWGLEEYAYPSAAQRADARRFVDAGADLILGHHPHVVQPLERIGHAIVAYSLGNAVFDEFTWLYDADDGHSSKQLASLTEDNRQGLIAAVEWNGNRITDANPIFTQLNVDGAVCIDHRPSRHADFARLCARLHHPLYAAWWRAYAIEREWTLRIHDRLRPSAVMRKLHRVRPRHIKDLALLLRRSGRMVTQATTNPYE